MSLTLVIGGIRSGKSDYAERLAHASGLPVRYVATADPSDPAMAQRIAEHLARRPRDWTTAQAGDDLDAALATDRCSLVDGLGTWIAGVFHRAGAFDSRGTGSLGHLADHVRAQIEALTEAAVGAEVIVVAEEAGLGMLPGDSVSRLWLDLLGDGVQRLSAAAQSVELVIAGRPIALAPPVLPTDASAALRRHGDEDVQPGDADHAVNVIADGPPAWLRAALAAALEGAADRYPDEAEATAALAALHGRDETEIVPTNGAAEALWLLGPALRPRLAACVHPGFTEAEAALRVHGIPVARVQRDPEAGFRLDPRSVPHAAELVIVGNPASPSGTLDPAPAILALRRPGRVVAVDEAFIGMVPGEPCSLARERVDDVIVIRSLTKLLSAPGLRVGYAIAAPPLASRLRQVRPPWSANALALAALAAAAARPRELAALAERARAERADLEHRLGAIEGLRIWPSATNFCLVEVADGPAVLAALRAQRIAVRPAASFPGLGPGHLRITAREPERNERVATAIAEALA